MTRRLEGKVALVTGAGGGIGSALCAAFLAEGARVAAVDIDEAAAAAALGDAVTDGRGIAVACDVGDPEAVRDAVSRAVATFGALNILVNIAGGSTDQDGPVTEAPDEEFWRVMRLDLFGTFLVCKHGLPEVIKSGGGSVINFTSVTALHATEGRDCYTAAKGGIASITRSIANGYAKHGVRVNAIAPGMTLTPRVEAMYERSPSMQAFAERHLMGPCTPEDMAHTAVFLASDESQRITGQILQVDSGVTIH